MISTVEFVTRLRGSQLLSAEQLAKVESAAATPQTAEQLAKRLVVAHWLTRWQAAELLNGHSSLRVGEYVLCDRLSRRPHAEIYQARDGQGRTVALKIWPVTYFANAEDLPRFEREVLATSALQHPHLIEVYGTAQLGKQVLLATEFFHPSSLWTALERPERLPPGWVIECLRQAALGLQVGFLQGLAHGHLSPGKILVSDPDPLRTPRVKVLGLGFGQSLRRAGPIDQIVRNDKVPSFADYLAPERLAGVGPNTAAGDLYSLGVILFQLLTGQLPFAGADPLARLQGRGEGPVRSMFELRADVPAALATVQQKLMAREPNQRFRTPGELAAVLATISARERSGQASGKSGILVSGSNSGLAVPAPPPEAAPVATSESAPAVVAAPAATAVSPTTISKRPLPAVPKSEPMPPVKLSPPPPAPTESPAEIASQRASSASRRRVIGVLGDYQFLSELGRNDGAKLYFATHPHWGDVLLKVLRFTGPLENEARARMLREGRIASRCDHPNLLAFRETGTEGEHYFLALEIPAGRTLKDVLALNKQLPVAWACEVARQLCLAAQHLHERRLVQRDWDPEKIFLGYEDFDIAPVVKLTGYGKAQTDDRALKGDTVTEMEGLLGHADYMSPEQAVNPRLVEMRSDLYCIGALLFHMLTGQVAFDGSSSFEKVDLRAKEDPPKVAWLRPDISPDLDHTVVRLMDRDPLRRFKTGNEAANVLAAWALTAAVPKAAKRLSAAAPEAVQQADTHHEELRGFFNGLESSKLLAPEQLGEAREAAAGLNSPPLFANRLVDQGLLTRWQAAELLSGRTDFFVGPYRLLQVLGTGPQTITYLGQRGTERPVVLKVLQVNSVADAEDVARFERTGRLSAVLQHPRIARVHETTNIQGKLVQVREFLPGKSLRECLQRHKRLPIGYACEIARQVALGLQYLFEQGIVHRDIEPAHLLVVSGSDGSSVKILGLGSALPMDRQIRGSTITRMGELIGSPDYIAPEQAENPTLTDTRADIYALGATLFHLLTGRVAFEGPSPMARLTARYKNEIPRVRPLRPEVKHELDAVISKMLQLEPEGRYSTPMEVAEALEPFAEHLPIDLLAELSDASGGPLAAATAEAPCDVGELVDLMEDAGLVDRKQVNTLRARLATAPDMDSATRELIASQLVTEWQVQQLREGRNDFALGTYQLVDCLSVSAFDTVYRAKSASQDDVAIKLFSVEQSRHAQKAQRIERLQKLSNELTHVHLPAIREMGHEQNRLFLATQFVPGRDLGDLLNNHPRLPVEWCCAVIAQVAGALDLLQQHGLPHLGLQPAHIRVADDDLQAPPLAMLVNYGHRDAGLEFKPVAEQSTQVDFKFDYVAPEQINDPEKADTRSDVYSLGCLLFEMLTGRPPFEGTTVIERVTNRLSTDAPALGVLRGDAPPALEAIVARLLSRDPAQRYQFPGDLTRALAPFCPDAVLPSTPLRSQGPQGGPQTTFKIKTPEQLFSLLELSLLLTREQLGQARRESKSRDDVQLIADRLVDRGMLTRWQMTQLMSGSRDFFLSKYKLVDCVGKGATGNVYKAADPQGRIVALKVLSVEPNDEDENTARFLREGRVATALDHPNIVAVHAASHENDRHFLVMEFVDGRDLKSWVNAQGPLPQAWACECARQTALGLEYAHQHGIVHRDVKPSNLLVVAADLDVPPKVKILDLGVASAARRELKGPTLTRMNQILGTPDYMAPEQAQDPIHADIRADVYSLGCTLFHLLAGRPPFDGDSAVAKLTARFKREAPLLRTMRPEAPPELEAILAKALARDPRLRYQTPGEFAKALLPYGLVDEQGDQVSLNTSLSASFLSTECEEFYANVQRSNLLDSNQLPEARRIAILQNDPRVVAKQLCDANLLTRWQARQLLDGRIDFLLGDYQLLDLVGRGATGNVYKARSRGGAIVALKVLSPDLLKKPEAVSRFRREMRLVAALKHPNIVLAYDTGQLGDETHYIAMEFVEGRDLKSWLSQHGPLPIDWSCECIRQAALGLQHAHEQGIIHRDIKPGNLLVMSPDTSSKPVVKLLDMGFANATSRELKKSSLTRADQLLGTPDYMSPEQAEDPTRADARSDIYSLGCTLFRLLTGRAPFLGDSPIEKLNARFREDAPRVTSLRPDCPPELDDLVARMLLREPDRRQQTSAEIAIALCPFALGAPGQSSEMQALEAKLLQEGPVPIELSPDGQRSPRLVPALIFVVGCLGLAGLLWGVHPLATVGTALIGIVGGFLISRSGSSGGQPLELEDDERLGSYVTAAVDLLEAIHPSRDAVHGRWEVNNQGLLTPDLPYARLQIPFDVPNEYTVSVRAQRMTGDAALIIGLVCNERQFFVTLDGWSGTYSGLGLIDSKPYDSNPTTYKGEVFTNKKPAQILVHVNETSVRVTADNKEIVNWTGQMTQLGMYPGWAVPEKGWLFIGSHTSSFLITELQLHARAEALRADPEDPEATAIGMSKGLPA